MYKLEIIPVGYSEKFFVMFESFFLKHISCLEEKKRPLGQVFFSRPRPDFNISLGDGHEKFFYICPLNNSPETMLKEYGRIVYTDEDLRKLGEIFKEFASLTGSEIYLTCPQANLACKLDGDKLFEGAGDRI